MKHANIEQVKYFEYVELNQRFIDFEWVKYPLPILTCVYESQYFWHVAEKHQRKAVIRNPSSLTLHVNCSAETSKCFQMIPWGKILWLSAKADLLRLCEICIGQHDPNAHNSLLVWVAIIQYPPLYHVRVQS